MLAVQRSGIARRVVTASHYVTWQLGKRWPKAVPLVYVVGYPKSGTTWVCQLAASYLHLPFPQHSLLPVSFAAVVHGHELVDKKYPYCVYVMRDGRDAMTSLYYHLQRLVRKGVRGWLPKSQLAIYLDGIDEESIRRNFPRFLETQISQTLGCHYSWGRHVSSFLDCEHSRVACLRYEDLLTDGAYVLAHQMALLSDEEPNFARAEFVLQEYSFSQKSGRLSGQEDKSSFLRKGTAGDWRNHFNPEAAEIFDAHCGTALIAAGYEPDRTWVDRVGTTHKHEAGPRVKRAVRESRLAPAS